MTQRNTGYANSRYVYANNGLRGQVRAAYTPFVLVWQTAVPLSRLPFGAIIRRSASVDAASGESAGSYSGQSLKCRCDRQTYHSRDRRLMNNAARPRLKFSLISKEEIMHFAVSIFATLLLTAPLAMAEPVPTACDMLNAVDLTGITSGKPEWKNGYLDNISLCVMSGDGLELSIVTMSEEIPINDPDAYAAFLKDAAETSPTPYTTEWLEMGDYAFWRPEINSLTVITIANRRSIGINPGDGQLQTAIKLAKALMTAFP
jgi:hypothetical protein